MRRQVCLFVTTATLLLATHALADNTTQPPADPARWWSDLPRQETLTGNWFGLGEALETHGITVSLDFTQIYQQNLKSAGRGGSSLTHRHSGRYTNTWDLEITFDIEKIANIPGGQVVAYAQGGWGMGLDDSSVPNLFGVNADAMGDEAIQFSELFWQQSLLGGTIEFRIGKIDLTRGFDCRHCGVAFDGNAYANDENAQFLNGALVNNPTIPFPDYALGAAVVVHPIDGWYVSAGVADAQAAGNETGFNTAFHEEDYFFAIFETGVAPVFKGPNGDLPGGYRFGFWYDPQPKDRLGPDSSGSETAQETDDLGFYISADQLVLKENDDEEDTQGLGLFARFGLTRSRVNDLANFWSVGGQYTGLLPARDSDVLGVGFAQGTVSRDIADYTAYGESVLEVYYSIEVFPWLHIDPSVQYLWYPGAVREVKDAVIIGARVRISG